jgi:succinate dehydrogenase/fumarate reductase-like Fe-S protein
MSSNHTATLVVQRGAPGEETRWERFEVGFEPGQSVLDGIRKVRVQQDPTLAIRFSCINANACKECMILVDGKVEYACTRRLEPREMKLQPLPKKALVRDLVTEIAPPDERIG